jgi:hypothetical protein
MHGELNLKIKQGARAYEIEMVMGREQEVRKKYERRHSACSSLATLWSEV